MKIREGLDKLDATASLIARGEYAGVPVTFPQLMKLDPEPAPFPWGIYCTEPNAVPSLELDTPVAKPLIKILSEQARIYDEMMEKLRRELKF